MRRFFQALAIAGYGLVVLTVSAVVIPLAAVMRTDRQVRDRRELELEAIGYDDDDIGHDVDDPAAAYAELLGQPDRVPTPGISGNACGRCGFDAGPYHCSSCGAT